MRISTVSERCREKLRPDTRSREHTSTAEGRIEISQLRALVATVDHGSFLAASEATGVAQATLRSRVARLERDLGMPLLARTQSGVRPTEAGAQLVDRGRDLVLQADLLRAEVAGAEPDVPLDTLRLCGPVGVPPSLAAAALGLLRTQRPDIRITVTHVADPIGAAPPDTDLILHFGALPPDGPFQTFTLRRIRLGLLASADYLAARGTPASPRDLAGHELLVGRLPDLSPTQWRLTSGQTQTVRPAVVSNDLQLVIAATAAGQGIALVPEDAYRFHPLPPRVALVPVLPGLLDMQIALRVLLPVAHARSARCRAVVGVMRELAQAVGMGSLEPDAR